MTIAAAYLTSEGVVLGADSTSTISASAPGGAGGQVVVQLLNHAQKVFEVGQGGRLGVCTYGTGHVKSVSQRTIVARVADLVREGETTVESAAELLEKEVVGVLKGRGEAGAGPIGYYIGGWSPREHEPGCWKLEFPPDGSLPTKQPLKIGEASFSGNHIFFTRVFHGFDPRLPDLLFAELEKTGAGFPDDFRKRFENAVNAVLPRLRAGGYGDLPIREAIDFIHTHLHVTIKASKFTFGPPVAGGPIEIGFVTTDRRFRWACHKPHLSAVFEQETADNG